MDSLIGDQHGEVDQYQRPRCMGCNRPCAHERWAPGLVALRDEDRVGWLCEDCAALPGRAWAFVDAVRTLEPAAEFLITAVYAGRLVRAPLVVPDPEPDEPPASPQPRRLGTDRLLPMKSPAALLRRAGD